jgi:hypothetical protein
VIYAALTLMQAIIFFFIAGLLAKFGNGLALF